MANDDWDSAHKAVRGSYDVFKPSALNSQQIPTNKIHKIRAKLVAENVLTLGLSNVYRLVRSKKDSERHQFNKNLGDKIDVFCFQCAASFHLDAQELGAYLKFRLGATTTPPEVTPVNSVAFDNGWQALKAVHTDVFTRFGVGQ